MSQNDISMWEPLAREESELVSAIIPTIGRAESLTRLLESLVIQTQLPDEVIVADGSDDNLIREVIEQSTWREHGLNIQHITVQPPNAVRQRVAAIRASHGQFLLLLDDDVVLEPQCLENLIATVRSAPDIVAATADFSNQSWSQPTKAWLWYVRWWCGMRAKEWQGRVVGPLLRFGYFPIPTHPVPMEWLGAGNSVIRRAAYDSVGGFSSFFLHRCTINEDVDLGIKLRRAGRIMLCPAARMAHLHAPRGRVSPLIAAEDDLYNRYLVLRRTMQHSVLASSVMLLLYFVVETASSIIGCIRRLKSNGCGARFWGRLRAIGRILLGRLPAC